MAGNNVQWSYRNLLESEILHSALFKVELIVYYLQTLLHGVDLDLKDLFLLYVLDIHVELQNCSLITTNSQEYQTITIDEFNKAKLRQWKLLSNKQKTLQPLGIITIEHV
jgi:hypothetical protein